MAKAIRGRRRAAAAPFSEKLCMQEQKGQPMQPDPQRQDKARAEAEQLHYTRRGRTAC